MEESLFDTMSILAERADGKTSSLQNQFFPNEEERDYSKDKILIGIDNRENEVFLDTRNSERIFILGATGAGKTFLTRGICDRLIKAGTGVVYLTDIKPEYYTSSKPLQSKFHKLLGEDEKPCGWGDRIKNYRPIFFKKFNIKDTIKSKTCQLSLSQINVFDFLTLFQADKDKKEKRVALEKIFDKISNGLYDKEEIIEMIKESTDKRMGKSIISVFEYILDKGIIGDIFSDFSFAEDLADDKIPILNLCGVDRMGVYINYPSAYVAVIIRDIIRAKNEGLIPRKKKILMVIEELHMFCPNIGENTAKKQIMKCLRIGREAGISMCFCTQHIKKIPEEIWKQCRYILIPGGVADIDEISHILKQTGLYTNPQTFTARVARIKRECPTKHHWILIDKTRGNWYKIFKPVAPLSHHKEEGE